MKETRNTLLAAVPVDSRARLLESLERVPIRPRAVISDFDCPVDSVLFVEHGVVSVVAADPDGSAVEIATVGCEGMVGLSLFLGTDRSPVQAMGQVEGIGLRLSAERFYDEVQHCPGLAPILSRYTQAYISQIGQNSACNRLHTMRQRCARWLLQTHDRVEGDRFSLTQEFLAEMLGVRRATVNEAARALQQAGLIEFEYRQITIVDRAGLEAAACPCYHIVKREYDRLIKGGDGASSLKRAPTAADGETLLHPVTHADDPGM